MPPAARITDMHVCPMVTPGVPPIPHVGGPILPPGVPTVLIDFLPAATVTDMALCVGPPDTIVMGSTGVFINYLPAARLGDPTAHGGVITLGSPTCIIGEVGAPSPGAVGLWGVTAGMAASKTSLPDDPTILGEAMARAQTSAVAMVTGPSDALAPTQTVANVGPPTDSSDHGKNVDSKIVCGLKIESPSISCQHGGRVPKDGLLEVVPSSGGDTITCISQAIGGCGKHPLWEIGGYWTTEKIGGNTSFNARDFEALPQARLILPVWLGDISPHVYEVSVASCSGPSYSFEVHTYPKDSQEAKIGGKVYAETFKDVLDHISDVLTKLLGNPTEIKFLEGSGQYSTQWKEDDHSNLAYYSWSISLGFSPLVGLKIRLPLSPQAVPPPLSKYGNAGFFLEAKGEVTVAIEGSQIAPPDSDKGHFDVKSETSLIIAIGGSVFLGESEDDSWIKAEVAMQTGVKLGLTGMLVERRPVMDGEITLGGLHGYCIVKFLLYESKYDCTFFDDQEVWDDDFHPFASNDA